jgi:hypothetical protein
MCPPTNTVTFNTTSAVCLIVMRAIPVGWECSSADGRTITVAGATTQSFNGGGSAVTGGPTTPGADGNIYFNVTAGTYSFTSFTCF